MQGAVTEAGLGGAVRWGQSGSRAARFDLVVVWQPNNACCVLGWVPGPIMVVALWQQ